MPLFDFYCEKCGVRIESCSKQRFEEKWRCSLEEELEKCQAGHQSDQEVFFRRSELV